MRLHCKRLRVVLPLLVCASLASGCAAMMMERQAVSMTEEYNNDAQYLYIHRPERLKQTRKVVVPDFRVLFPSGGERSEFTVFEGTAYEGRTFLATQELGMILAEYFEEALLPAQRIEVLERNQLQRVLAEQDLQMSGLTQTGSMKPGMLGGADTVLLGSMVEGMMYFPNDPMMPQYVRIRMIDVETGEILLIYRDRQMRSGHLTDEQEIYITLANRFVDALKKEGILDAD